MKRIIVLAAGLAALGLGAAARAEGDPEAGKQLAATVCAACHMPDGNSINPVWPKLAGQHEKYFIEQIKAYKTGERDDSLMTPQARMLSEEDIRNLAAWYAGQNLKPGAADPALVEKGQRIFRGGIAEKGVPACLACHDPTGQGNATAGYPVVAGQHAPYIVAQLKLYADGARKSDAEYNQMMRDVAAGMNEDDMRAIASYLQGLHPAD